MSCPSHLPVSAALLILASCSGEPASTTPSSQQLLDPWQVVLAPVAGDSDLDHLITGRQEKLREASDPIPHLQRLGSLFVLKARRTFDAGYYKLAEQCAACIEQKQPGHPDALLLQGHVLHNLHRFADAEAIARELVRVRGDFLDHGLLGDVLLDRGDLREALASYQKMLDQKPCLQSYVRAAQVRWLRGDLDGSRQLLRLATGAGSPRAPESLAWAYTRLAVLELQAGELPEARRVALAALKLLPDYAPALLARGRIDLAEGDVERAIADMQRAADLNPLPEYQWALADALRSAGLSDEAARVEDELEQMGDREDPRTFALYLATRGKLVAHAVDLTRAELAQRRDVHTHDAHAWALLAAGQEQSAQAAIEIALSQDTQDARLFYHAGAIAAANEDPAQARRWLDRADGLRRMLLPSEQRDLRRRRAAL